ncbi:MAG: zf-TFIIB domain-containing protein [Nannocystaceae bacterium]|nr:zf-TFIIB domain-containing protein [bacterium]
MDERSLPCPGCADGTRLVHWPPPSASPYRPTPEHAVRVQACRVCAGVWVDTETLQEIIDGAANAAASGTSSTVRRKTMPPGLATGKVTYRHCPLCKQSMLRRNFGSISGIVVDVCAKHGTFFDYGELPEVVDFVRSGGLALAKRHADAEHARESRHRVRNDIATSPGMGPAWLEGDLRDPGSDEMLRRVAVFVRNMFR